MKKKKLNGSSNIAFQYSIWWTVLHCWNLKHSKRNVKINRKAQRQIEELFHLGALQAKGAEMKKKNGKEIKNSEDQLRLSNISLVGAPTREKRAHNREETEQETIEGTFPELNGHEFPN